MSNSNKYCIPFTFSANTIIKKRLNSKSLIAFQVSCMQYLLEFDMLNDDKYDKYDKYDNQAIR